MEASSDADQEWRCDILRVHRPGPRLLAWLRTPEGSGYSLQNSLAEFSRWVVRVPFCACSHPFKTETRRPAIHPRNDGWLVGRNVRVGCRPPRPVARGRGSTEQHVFCQRAASFFRTRVARGAERAEIETNLQRCINYQRTNKLHPQRVHRAGA